MKAFIVLSILLIFWLSASVAQENEYLPVNLGPKVNSKNGEGHPVLSADGRELYFWRELFRKEANGDVQSIWYSSLDAAGNWAFAKYMPKPLNIGVKNSAVFNLSTDNNTLLIRGYFQNSQRTNGNGFSIVQRGLNGWKDPVGIDIDKFTDMDNGKYDGAFMLPDGKGLLITMSEAEGSGNSDLYYSTRKADGTYTKPAYIKFINSQFDESAPFVAADNKTLYFSSDREGTLGSNDIWKTTRLDDTWLNWTEPINMGATINTDKWDSYFFLDARGEYAYMASSATGGQGSSDIVRIKLKEELKPKPVVLIKGRVLNKATNAPIEASITYDNLESTKNEGIAISDPVSGSYQIALPYGSNYAFNSEANNFISVSDNIDLRTVSEYKEITRDLYLVPIEKGQVVRINNIFFEFGKADLKPESFLELNRIASLMQGKTALEIELGGHTDNVGSDEANLKLSADRALAVQKYLTAKNISTARIKVAGYGKTKPVATNDTEEGRMVNRRVEFTILNF